MNDSLVSEKALDLARAALADENGNHKRTREELDHLRSERSEMLDDRAMRVWDAAYVAACMAAKHSPREAADRIRDEWLREVER